MEAGSVWGSLKGHFTLLNNTRPLPRLVTYESQVTGLSVMTKQRMLEGVCLRIYDRGSNIIPSWLYLSVAR